METGSRVKKFKDNVINFKKVNLLKRADYGYKRRYLEGRFGGMQIINESLINAVMGE